MGINDREFLKDEVFMEIKIDDKILSLPPYISTSWKNVISLWQEKKPSGPVLIIDLTSGNRVEIPNLDHALLEKIFHAHTRYLEQEHNSEKFSTSIVALPFPLPNLANLTSILEHNSQQSNIPDLPAELLEKISMVTRNLIPEGASVFPQAEPHCNCPYCQIMRALQQEAQQPLDNSSEEAVSDDELLFRTWDIKQEGSYFYSVTNPANPKEQYSVFLGEPSGCTCGQNNCEHIQVVRQG